MTEKRLFGIVKGHREHIADHTGRLYSDSEVGDLLNKLLEENEQLKADNNRLKIKNKGLQSELEIRKADVDYANKISNELFDECKQHKKENEQLKKEILWWKYRCGEDISGDVE